MVLFIIALLFVVLGFFCRAQLVKRLLWAAAALTLIAASSFLWADAQFAAANCTGNIVQGLACPEPSLLTRIAMAHLGFGLVMMAAGVFAAPTVMIIALWLEIRYRRRQEAP